VGVISGTPTNADALNGPYAVTVTATDGTESIGASFQLNVLNVNDAPVLVSARGERNRTADGAFSLDISGHFDDPDATELGFSASGLPASLSISSTGTISGTPTNADIANSPYSVTVTATDGTLVATDSFTLTIDNVNDAPGLVSA